MCGGVLVANKNEANVRKYRVLSSIYDWFAGNPLLERPRKRQFDLADIQPGDRVLIVGVGTGPDLTGSVPPRAEPGAHRDRWRRTHPVLDQGDRKHPTSYRPARARPTRRHYRARPRLKLAPTQAGSYRRGRPPARVRHANAK
jgi:hypothetical protein